VRVFVRFIYRIANKYFLAFRIWRILSQVNENRVEGLLLLLTAHTVAKVGFSIGLDLTIYILLALTSAAGCASTLLVGAIFFTFSVMRLY